MSILEIVLFFFDIFLIKNSMIEGIHSSPENDTINACLSAAVEVFLKDIDLELLQAFDAKQASGLELIGLVTCCTEASLSAMDNIVLTLCFGEDENDEEITHRTESISNFMNSVFIGEILRTCSAAHTMENILKFMGTSIVMVDDITAHSTLSELQTTLFKLVRRFYSLQGRLLSHYFNAASLDEKYRDSFFDITSSFLKAQLMTSFSGLKAHADELCRLTWQSILHINMFNEVHPSTLFQPTALFLRLQELPVPFMLPYLSHLSLLGQEGEVMAGLRTSVAAGFNSLLSLRIFTASLLGLQQGLYSNNRVNSLWFSLFIQGGGYESLLGVLEIIGTMNQVGCNCVSFAERILGIPDLEYDALRSYFFSLFPHLQFCERDDKYRKRQFSYLTSVKSLFIYSESDVIGDLFGVMAELEQSRPSLTVPSSDTVPLSADIATRLLDVVLAVTNNNKGLNSLMFSILNVHTTGQIKLEVNHLENSLVPPSVFKACTSFFSNCLLTGTVCSPSSAAISEEDSRKIEFLRYKYCQLVTLLLYSTSYYIRAISVIIESKRGDPVQLEKEIQWVRDSATVEFRCCRQIFGMVSVEFLFLEVDLPAPFIDNSRYQKHFSRKFGVGDTKTVLFAAYVLVLESYINFENILQLESLGQINSQMTRNFQLLTSSFGEIMRKRFYEIQKCSEVYVAFGTKYIGGIENIIKIVLRRNLLVHQESKMAFNSCCDIVDIILQIMLRVSLDSSLGISGFAERLHNSCLALSKDFPSNYALSVHLNGRDIQMRSSDVCLIIRNTIFDYAVRSYDLNSTVTSAPAKKRGTGATKVLVDIFNSLKDFLKEGSSAERIDLLQWELKMP